MPTASAPDTAAQPPPPTSQPMTADYVGSATCGSCHHDALQQWHESDHAHAMLPATDDAVLGDFSGVTLTTGARHGTFFRRDGQPVMRTEGADSHLAEFEVRHTFGWHPLQQYLADTGAGRLQVLPFAWDSREQSAGGQRWFSLQTDPAPEPGDSLHWMGRDQNWNFMCAGCHSTDLQKRYDAKTERFDTRWSDINVGCEACHGPGSAHVAWARGGARPNLPSQGLTVPKIPTGRWEFATPGAGIAHWNGGERHGAMDTCFVCHSRRREIANPLRADVPLLDQIVPSLIEPGLYAADGQIDGEVFEYGSFLQSRMYRAGVICQDCHQPHDGKLRASGNGLCAQCHAPATFDTPEHHHHAAGSAGSQCVDCHMAGRTYMGVDFRRDHGFRLPRPDLSERLETPDACTGCHSERPARWAAEEIRRWIGREPGRGHAPVAEAFSAAWAHRVEGGPALLALLAHPDASTIMRASAVAALADYPGPRAQGEVRAAAHSTEPLLRLGALRALHLLPTDEQIGLLVLLLDDRTRAVRIEAARIAVAIPDERLDDTARRRLGAVEEELIATETIHADRPESHLNLALIHASRGRIDAAEAELQHALRMDADFVPARVNLADLYRAAGRDAEALPLLEEGLRLAPDSADLHHALGLLDVRRGRRTEALEHLATAAQGAPDNPRYAYVYAVALADGGSTDEAIAVARSALDGTPNNTALAQLLAQLQTGH